MLPLFESRSKTISLRTQMEVTVIGLEDGGMRLKASESFPELRESNFDCRSE